jgi:IS1 family transposase
MNKLSIQERVRVISALVEGSSINSTVRMTGVAKTTILRLMAQLGDACEEMHDKAVRNLQTKRVQCDEVWAFCYAKAKNVPAELKGQFGYGDVWTWTAIDADSKLMISWLVAPRHAGSANEIMHDVAKRLTQKIQLTTDGHHTYLSAVGNAFPGDVDYAQLIKIYGQEPIAPGRYSPPKCIAIETRSYLGNPDPAHVSTSFVERSNLTVRMGVRRYTRLTNGFSKKLDNHCHMTAIFFTYYNWCRIHGTTKVTPAMAAGLTEKLWEIEYLIGLLK